MGQPKCHLAFQSRPDTATVRPDASRTSPPAPVKPPVVSAEGRRRVPPEPEATPGEGRQRHPRNALTSARRGRSEAHGRVSGGGSPYGRDRSTRADDPGIISPACDHRRARRMRVPSTSLVSGASRRHGDRLLERIGANDVLRTSFPPSACEGIDGRIVTGAGPRARALLDQMRGIAMAQRSSAGDADALREWAR